MTTTATQAPYVPLPPRIRGRFLDAVVRAVGTRREDLDVIARDAERMRVPIADALVTSGKLSEPFAYAALAEATGAPLLSPLRNVTPAALAIRIVPARVARRHNVVPIALTDRVLTYATSTPYDDDADRDVGFVSGRRAEAALVYRRELDELLTRHYPTSSELETIVGRVRSSATIEPLAEFNAGAMTDSAVIELCNHLIARAAEAGASDIHIDATHTGAVIAFRVGGILETVTTIPASAAPAVCNRFKIMARADISVRLKPQDGAFAMLVDGRRLDIRLSSVPTVNGEKQVLRLIDSRSQLCSLEQLGYSAPVLTGFRAALNRPDGLVLVTGPTGSGKTTALYGALDVLRTRALNIVTVEDPVERAMEGITQIPVNNRAGNTFATVLRSVLRQDPNVIMVGEIRDAEVAGILGQAAYTGHLVLSSLHTTDAVTAIVRLLNLGLEPFKVAESLSAILAQRLVRRLCPSCRKELSEFDGRKRGQELGVAHIGATVGPGCPTCRFTGYAGRAVVSELLMPDSRMRDAIAQGAPAGELRAAMRASGSVSMQEAATAMLRDGVTSIQEVRRVLSAEEIAKETAGQDGARRVLVVEDDTITRMLVKLLLERDGYTVLEARNGRQAVEIAVRERPSLMVMDLNMPEMNGYEALTHIRRVPALTAMPVLVLTAEEGPGVETTVLQLGADDYVLKPFDPGVLSSRIKAAFRRSAAQAA
jgi:type IV pilus assembly protein PilB